MHVFFGGLLAMALAPAGDPRTIDPAANRPEIVAPGGSPASAQPVKVRPPKGMPKPKTASKLGPPAPKKVGPRTQPSVGPRPAPKTNTTADAAPQGCFPERGRCWRLNVAGIVAASVGVGLLGSGIGFMQAPQFADPDEPIYNRSLRPPGVVMVAVGAVTVVTGVLMIVAGHATYGRAKRPNMARVQLAPGGLRW